jgi:hypothetical protein
MLEHELWNNDIPIIPEYKHAAIQEWNIIPRLFPSCKIKYAKRSEKGRWPARTILQWSRAGRKAL